MGCVRSARALEKDFPYGEQPRQRRPGLKNLKRQMPSCRTQLANLRAPSGRLRPVWPPRPNPQSYTARPRGRALNSQTCAPPGAPAPRVASASPTRKVTRPGLVGAPSTRKLARPPGAPAPRVASAPQPAKLHGQASWLRPQLAILRAPGAPAPRLASAPQPAKLHGQASWARPQLAILRAPRGAGAPCGLRALTRKVTSASALSEVPNGTRRHTTPSWASKLLDGFVRPKRWASLSTLTATISTPNREPTRTSSRWAQPLFVLSASDFQSAIGWLKSCDCRSLSRSTIRTILHSPFQVLIRAGRLFVNWTILAATPPA